jgi:hypothetical protein
MPRPLDGDSQLTLMPHAIPRNTAGDDPPPLGQKIPQQPGVFEIDRGLFQAEAARPPPLK